MNDFYGDWTPAVFEERGRELLKVIRCHFESIREIDVARPQDVPELISLLDESLPEVPEDFDRILADTLEKVIPNLVHWNHPSFYGYFPTCASFPGMLAETLTAALNVNAMTWRTSPAASALELVVLRWLACMIGYPPEADGVLVNGASLATLYALAAARDAAMDFDVGVEGLAAAGVRGLRVYASDQAHSSVGKAARTLGLGLANVVEITSDEDYRMRPESLAQAIEHDLSAGLVPVAVVATVGTTSVAATDPVGRLAEVCRSYGVWLHVDAAYGGMYALTEALRAELEDLSAGDSLVVSPQKTIFVPLEATALFCRRNGKLADSFRLVPDYLTSAADEGAIDYMNFSAQLGRSFRALKLWWVIRSFGRAGLAYRLENAVELARWLREAAGQHPDWRCPVKSLYPLVCLRYEPDRLAATWRIGKDKEKRIFDVLNARIMNAVNRSGEAFVSHSIIRDGYVLRVSIGNIHTTKTDVERMWQLLCGTAERVFEQMLLDERSADNVSG
jgi:aromatic-L-amino-acid decarboxylase